jgi:hypothetical protein
MAYQGNVPAEAYTTTVKDTFNGNGSTTAFTLSLPTVTNDIRVVVENVVQEPTAAYSVSGTTLTFTAAPPSGTNNVYVVHLGPAVQTVEPPSTIAGATVFASNVTVQGAFTSLGIDDNATSTAMTLDASGNLLVGTTDSNPTSSAVNVAGQSFSTTGGVRSTVASNPAATFNRKTDDGDIVLFRKDGTTVGSIGTANGYMELGSSDTGIRFYTPSDAVIPANPSTNSARDAAIDLGISSQRFKDLYLSGGVYLGGTVAANYLDDVETGTWTVALASSGTQPTYNFTSTSGGGASYIKVGRMVTIFFDRYVNITVAGTGNARITGLPFSSDLIIDYGGYSAVQFRASSAFGTSSYVTGYVDGNEILVEVENGASSSSANWTTGTNIRFSGTVTYRTA